MIAFVAVIASCSLASPPPEYTLRIGEPTAERVVRRTFVGTEVVLDVVTSLKMSPAELAEHNLAILRCDGSRMRQLVIDWDAITRRGIVTTNYQLLPGDELVVHQRRAK